MINLRRTAAVTAAALGLALGALAAPASAASNPAAVSAAHATFSVGGGAAPASSMPSKAATSSPAAGIVGAGSTVQEPNGWCTYTSWGGTYYCGSQSWISISGQLFQVFVIGTNNAVFTRWSNTSGVSGWVSLGGICAPGPYSTQEFPASSNAWNFGTECIGANGHYYDRIRSTNGSWSNWQEIPGPII
jgi:hypothetical protein